MSRRRDALAAGLTTLLGLLLTLPASAADRDRDGLSDGFEARYGVTDPGVRDSDHDGVIDAAEDNDRDGLGNLGEQRFGTNPGRRDTDGDGIHDGREDDDGDGRSNAMEQDQRRVPVRLKPTLGKAARSYPPIRARCITGQGDPKPVACGFGPRDAGTRVVLIGDSHALMWSSPIRGIARNKGWRLLTMAKTACPSLLGLYVQSQKLVDEGATCRAWRENILGRLNANPPDLIVIANSDRYSLHRPDGVKYPKVQRPALWKQALARTLAALPKSSRVLIVGSLPHNAGNPRNCLMQNRQDISACASPKGGAIGRKIEHVLKATAKARDARYGAVYGKVCSYDPCPLVQGNILVWRDKNHITDTFARQLQPTFRRWLEAALRSTDDTRSRAVR
jgi:hypothetical protein